jgi:hypothetical protein
MRQPQGRDDRRGKNTTGALFRSNDRRKRPWRWRFAFGTRSTFIWRLPTASAAPERSEMVSFGN